MMWIVTFTRDYFYDNLKFYISYGIRSLKFCFCSAFVAIPAINKKQKKHKRILVHYTGNVTNLYEDKYNEVNKN